MRIELDLNSLADYKKFLQVKSLPSYRFIGRTAEFPDCYADRLGIGRVMAASVEYEPLPGLFDYQEGTARVAIERQKFGVFMDCGMGKQLICFEFARHAQAVLGDTKRTLIVCPLMVVAQAMDECKRFYGDNGLGGIHLEQIRSRDLGEWIVRDGPAIGITNYEALRESVPQGNLGCLACDEASEFKSAYGKHGQQAIRLGKGLDWKLALTGTPAPNDRIEFANLAVFLDSFPTINSFLARFFVNRGQTQERWEMKPHAIGPFYRELSHWSIFVTDPSCFGWRDNTEAIPPIVFNLHHLDLTSDQSKAVTSETGMLFPCDPGGITKRSKLSQIAKGKYKGAAIATNKYSYIADLVASWPDESTIVWAAFESEQDELERIFPDAASIRGKTKMEKRLELIKDFQDGRRKVLISKSSVIGHGLNFQIATRQVFSTLSDSYESFYQAVKRSNRYGSTRPLNIHVPASEIEMPMVENVLRKARRIHEDTAIQQKLFREQLAWNQ